MSTNVLYCVPRRNSIFTMQALQSDAKQIYESLCLAITTKDLQKFLEIINASDVTYSLLNQPIFLCNSECSFPNCIALNLCHFAVFNDCRDILDELLKRGGDLSRKTVEVTISPDFRNFIEKDSVIELIVRNFDEPVRYLRDLFDRRIETADLGSTREFKFDFSILCPSDLMQNNTVQSQRQMCVLNEVVNASYDIYSDECGLLQHPLIEAFLTSKWIHYGRFFYILVAIHALFVGCLSTIALLIVSNFKYFSEMQQQNRTVSVQSQDHSINMTLTAIQNLDYFLMLPSLMLLAHAIVQMYFFPLRKLFKEFEIISNLLTSAFASINSFYGMIYPVRWQLRYGFKMMYILNSLVILPAWINLMLIIGRMPSLGCYSLMFTTVMKNFLKVMVSFIFLIIGFALSFSLMFPMSNFFNNPFGAVLRTVVMMVGEFDFAETFSGGDHFLNGPSQCIFLLFVVSCSIILMNLTQGIAVNDIKLLQEISQIIRLEKETRFLYEFECIFTHHFVTSNPVFRKIKKRLFDNGTVTKEMIITNENRQKLPKPLLVKLMQLYKPRNHIHHQLNFT